MYLFFIKRFTRDGQSITKIQVTRNRELCSHLEKLIKLYIFFFYKLYRVLFPDKAALVTILERLQDLLTSFCFFSSNKSLVVLRV